MLELAATSLVVRLLVLALIFAVVTGVILIVVNGVEARRRMSQQIARLDAHAASNEKTNLVRSDSDSRWAKIADSIERTGLSLTDPKNHKLENQLKMAGYSSPSAPRIYTMVRIGMVFLLPGIFLLLISFSTEPPGLLSIYLYCSILAALGLYIPNLFIRAKADRRKSEIINGFPDALDLVLVCVEAGLGLESALDRVGREMTRSHPLIAHLMIETVLMTRAGASRETALRQLADSSGVDEIRSFSTLLIQSDKLGTSIANTLRVYANEMREARRMRAEEKAHRIPVLISIPLVACMLPTMIGVLVLPAVIMFVRDIGPAMSGGG